MSSSVNKALVLFIGHRVTVYVEGIHVDGVDRVLVILAFVTPHQKISGRDVNHLLAIPFPGFVYRFSVPFRHR